MSRQVFFEMPTGPVKGRPETDDPKVIARREKARIYAQKKRDEAKQVKSQRDDDRLRGLKAASTINQAIKGKIARKALATAKAAKTQNAVTVKPATPAKKPAISEEAVRKMVEWHKEEDLKLKQKKWILPLELNEAAKAETKNWNKSYIETENPPHYEKNKMSETPQMALYKFLKRYSSIIYISREEDSGKYGGHAYQGDYGIRINDAQNQFIKQAKNRLRNIIKNYGKKYGKITKLHVKWVDFKDAKGELKDKMIEVRDFNERSRRNLVSREIEGTNDKEYIKSLRKDLTAINNWQKKAVLMALVIVDSSGNVVSPVYIINDINISEEVKMIKESKEKELRPNKIGDNLLNDLPEDLQKRIMKMAKEKAKPKPKEPKPKPAADFEQRSNETDFEFNTRLIDAALNLKQEDRLQFLMKYGGGIQKGFNLMRMLKFRES